MPIRMSGLVSGLDTESLIKSLMEAQTTKKTKVENKKTKLEWTQDKWKNMNTKLYSLYTDYASKMRLVGSYNTKKSSISDSSVASVTAKNNAINGNYSLEVNHIATANYVTSAKLQLKPESTALSITEDTKLSDLNGGTDLIGQEIQVSYGGKYKSLAVTAETTIKDYVNTINSTGMSASFDAGQQRIFTSSAASGSANNFSITVSSQAELDARDNLRNTVTNYSALLDDEKADLDKIITTARFAAAGSAEYNKAITDLYAYASASGISTNEAVHNAVDAYRSSTSGTGLSALGIANIKNGVAIETGPADMSVITGTDSEILLNGATLTGSDTTMNVNGLSLELKGITNGSVVSFSVANDTDATYNFVKNFIDEYNSILSEMNKAYYAESAHGYEPLTDDEKKSMSDDQVELWENKIKDSLLRNDSTLDGIITSMKNSMMGSVDVDGKSYSLSSLGIMTSKDYTEYGLLHIYGDKDDSTYADKTDKLKSLIESDPDLVTKIMTGISDQLYDAMNKKMATSTLSSALTFYNDKQMKKQMKSYEDDIDKWDTYLTDMENRYYKQFSDMEKAMAKLQNSQSAVTQLTGGQ